MEGRAWKKNEWKQHVQWDSLLDLTWSNNNLPAENMQIIKPQLFQNTKI